MTQNENSKIANAIESTLTSPNELDSNLEPANVVDGLFALSRSIQYGLQMLGNGDASTSMGALEALGKCMLDAGSKIADALDNVAEAIRESK